MKETADCDRFFRNGLVRQPRQLGLPFAAQRTSGLHSAFGLRFEESGRYFTAAAAPIGIGQS